MTNSEKRILCPSCQLSKGIEEKCRTCGTLGETERLAGLSRCKVLTKPIAYYIEPFGDQKYPDRPQWVRGNLNSVKLYAERHQMAITMVGQLGPDAGFGIVIGNEGSGVRSSIGTITDSVIYYGYDPTEKNSEAPDPRHELVPYMVIVKPDPTGGFWGTIKNVEKQKEVYRSETFPDTVSASEAAYGFLVLMEMEREERK